MQLKVGGKFHLRLNISVRPIANKYREGKMKRTLKIELTVREIAERETFEVSFVFVGSASQGVYSDDKQVNINPWVSEKGFENVAIFINCVIAWDLDTMLWIEERVVSFERIRKDLLTMDVGEITLSDPSWNTDQGV